MIIVGFSMQLYMLKFKINMQTEGFMSDIKNLFPYYAYKNTTFETYWDLTFQNLTFFPYPSE